MSTSARVCVLAAIDRLLAPDGVLFIGHADRLDWAGAEPRFTPAGDPGCFAYQRTARGTGVSVDQARPAARTTAADAEL